MFTFVFGIYLLLKDSNALYGDLYKWDVFLYISVRKSSVYS